MDLKYIELALFCFILLPSLGRCIRNKQDCDYDTKLPGCPCGKPLGSKRYMTKDEEYGCFICEKGHYYENILTMQCQLCGGLKSCKENVSPNACDQKYCEGDEPTTTSKMVTTTTTAFTTSVSRSPTATSNNDVSDVINTTPGTKDSYTTESVTRQSTEYHTFKAKEGFRNEDSSIEDSEEKKAPVPGGTDGLTTGAIIAIVVLLLGVVVIAIFKYRKYRNKKNAKVVQSNSPTAV